MVQGGAHRSRKRILVMDDQRAWQNDCLLELEQAGFLVEVCTHRAELEHLLATRRADFDVVVVDLEGTGSDHETLPPLTLLYPQLPFVIYSISDTMAAYYLDPKISNVRGYVLKQHTTGVLLQIVERVLQGEAGIWSEGVNVKHCLTPMQLTVLKLAAAGLTRDAMAKRLDITPGGVDDHCAKVIKNLNAVNMTNAVYLAMRRGLIK